MDITKQEGTDSSRKGKTMENITIVDVSSNNNVNLTTLKSADFFIIKATEGETYVNPKMKKQVEQAGKKLFGFYHFFTTRDPEKQARNFIKAVEPYANGNVTLWLDFEGTAANKAMTKEAAAFIHTVESHFKRKVGIYASKSVLGLFKGTDVTDRPLWVAWYYKRAVFSDSNVRPFKPENVVLWQYTGTGKIDGCAENLDLSKPVNLNVDTNDAQSEAQKERVLEYLTAATSVLYGLYGNGPIRTVRLRTHGFNPEVVQEIVNYATKMKNTNIIKATMVYTNNNGVIASDELKRDRVTLAQVKKCYAMARKG